MVALSADRWSMLLRERPIAAIGERCDPDVLDATTWRESGRRQKKKKREKVDSEFCQSNLKCKRLHVQPKQSRWS